MGGGYSVINKKNDSARDLTCSRKRSTDVSCSENSKLISARFHQVLKVMRDEATPTEFRINRKKQLATAVAEIMQQEKERIAMEAQNKRQQEIQDELIESQKLLFSLIDYELSDDDSNCEEEDFDVNRAPTPVSVLSNNQEESATNQDTTCSNKQVTEALTASNSSGNGINGDRCNFYGDDDSDVDEEAKAEHSRPPERSDMPYGEFEPHSYSLNYTPKRSSIIRNKETAKLKKQQHKLHSVMRQESLEAHKSRASEKLEKRKKKKDKNDSTSVEVVDNELFEAKKNIVKQYVAYDDKRRTSVKNRHTQHREALTRRLQQRKQENSRS